VVIPYLYKMLSLRDHSFVSKNEGCAAIAEGIA